MPTHDETDSFRRDFARLNSTDKQRFLSVLEAFVADLSAIETGTRKNFVHFPKHRPTVDPQRPHDTTS